MLDIDNNKETSIQLSEVEERSLREVIANNHFFQIQPSNPEECFDCFDYTLRVTMDKIEHTVQWTGNSVDTNGLFNIIEVIKALIQR